MLLCLEEGRQKASAGMPVCGVPALVAQQPAVWTAHHWCAVYRGQIAREAPQDQACWGHTDGVGVRWAFFAPAAQVENPEARVVQRYLYPLGPHG